jgi:hypothetical protein
MRKQHAIARRLAGSVLLVALEVFAAGALLAVATAPAQAQWGFQQWFGGPGPRRQQGGYGWPWQQQEPRREAPVDYSRAPPPHKREAPATTNVLVLGDSMSDWLAYGLEEAFAETPEIGVTRKPRTNRGLIKTEGRDGYDAVAAAREMLANEKPDYVVMMIGLADRTSIRDRPRPAQTTPAAKQPPAQAQPPQQAAKPAEQPHAPPAADAEAGGEEPAIVAPAQETGPAGSTIHQFRTDKWAELYAKRIDETIAVLKAKGVPVLWVGLPAIRGTRSTADMVYLNDLYRDRAGKAGIVYVDIWDGFVDESGNYVNQGPDFEGQIRRLRAGDGVHFTKAGARKLAHYVEREIRRVMLTRGAPVAMPVPTEKETPAAVPGKPGAPTRPVAGPVVPLTGPAAAGSDGLLGGGPARTTSADPMANRVLVKGEPVPAPAGRADNFAWPRPDSVPPSTSLTEPPEPPAAASAAPATGEAKPPTPAPAAKQPPKRPIAQAPRQQQPTSLFGGRDDQPRPPGSVPRSNNSNGGWWSGWGR